MATIVKITLKFNLNNLSVGMNSFFFRDSVDIGSDAGYLAAADTWMDDFWAPLRPVMDSGVVLMSASVDEIVAATGHIDRHIGGITPVVNGTNNSSALPQIVAGSMFARTDVPKVRGGKRIAGFHAGGSVEGLFTNTVLTALAAAATVWIDGPAGYATFNPGVWSSKVSGFVDFIPQAGVTNIPGSQVTRKIGRGL